MQIQMPGLCAAENRLHDVRCQPRHAQYLGHPARLQIQLVRQGGDGGHLSRTKQLLPIKRFAQGVYQRQVNDGAPWGPA